MNFINDPLGAIKKGAKTGFSQINDKIKDGIQNYQQNKISKKQFRRSDNENTDEDDTNTNFKNNQKVNNNQNAKIKENGGIKSQNDKQVSQSNFQESQKNTNNQQYLIDDFQIVDNEEYEEIKLQNYQEEDLENEDQSGGKKVFSNFFKNKSNEKSQKKGFFEKVLKSGQKMIGTIKSENQDSSVQDEYEQPQGNILNKKINQIKNKIQKKYSQQDIQNTEKQNQIDYYQYNSDYSFKNQKLNYKNDLLEIPQTIPKKLQNKILHMIVKNGRKYLDPNYRKQVSNSQNDSDEDDVSPYDQNAVQIKNRQVNLVQILDSEIIEIKFLRKAIFNGVPFQNQKEYNLFYSESSVEKVGKSEQISHSLRAISWRILLGVIGLETSKWEKEMQNSSELYEVFKNELIKDRKSMMEVYKGQMDIYEKDFAIAKHYHKEMRLQEIRKSNGRDINNIEEIEQQTNIAQIDKKYRMHWDKFFKDQDIWTEIKKDLRRTRSDLGFFKQPLDSMKILSKADEERIDMQLETSYIDLKNQDLDKYIFTHSDILGRILFIYAKLNPGIMYVQGMNEVCAVIYYTFWIGGNIITGEDDLQDFFLNNTANSKGFRSFESDVFTAFTNLMVDLRDGFLRELDRESSGLDGHILHYDRVLQVLDRETWSLIVEEGQVSHQYYTLRWFMLLLCQEFNLSCTLRLWDTLISAEGPPNPTVDDALQFEKIKQTNIEKAPRFQFIDYIAVALVQNVRQEIIDGEGEFSVCMESLQQTSQSFQDLQQLESLMKNSMDICFRWMRWLVRRSSQSQNINNKAFSPQDYFMYNQGSKQIDDQIEYDEQIEEEYGEEECQLKYSKLKIYEELLLN